MNSANIVARGGVLALLVVMTTSVVPNGNDVSCIQGRLRCYDNLTCVDLYDDMDYCDTEITTCNTIHRAQCQRVLLEIQNNPYFRTCTCDASAHDADECLTIQSRIFMHRCIDQPAIQGGQPWPRHSSSRQGSVVSPEDLEAIEQSLDKEPSCIGVRQLCLKNMQCHEAFKTFQDACTMKRELDICTATDRDACFDAIETIKPTGLFECECKAGMKPQPLLKCERIQARLAKNPCLVTVPYYHYTSQKYESTFKDLALMISSHGDMKYDTVSTCSQAFSSCNEDPTCRLRLAEAINSCNWSQSHAHCDRSGCLEAIKQFYLLARPEKTHALMLCRCRDGDQQCEAVKAAIYPTCSVMQAPPPTCLDILQRCSQDDDCRTRWQAYKQYCSYDKKMRGCPAGNARCRNSQAGIMGTILMTNCTCALHNTKEQEKCLDAREQLQNRNQCMDMVFDDFHTYHTTTPHTYWADAAAVTASHDCLRELDHKIPIFMNTPTVIRRYNNHSDCSDICQCRVNGTLMCKKLPCGPNLHCKTKTGQVYHHGSSFSHRDRGQCRCIRGEMVCAKSPSSMQPKPGLFFHVGYSLSDQYLLEDNSVVRFTPRQVADKFGTLLNGDSAEQFCSLSLYRQTEANLIFEIQISDNSPIANKEEGCVTPAKMLSNKVNSRDPVIVTDAELSIVKVAQLEIVRFFEDQPRATQQPLTGEYSSATLRVTASLKNMAAGLVLFCICCQFLSGYSGNLDYLYNKTNQPKRENICCSMENLQGISELDLNKSRYFEKLDHRSSFGELQIIQSITNAGFS